MEMNHLSELESERDWRLLISRLFWSWSPAWTVSLWPSSQLFYAVVSWWLVSLQLQSLGTVSTGARNPPRPSVHPSPTWLARGAVCTTVRDWWPGEEWGVEPRRWSAQQLVRWLWEYYYSVSGSSSLLTLHWHGGRLQTRHGYPELLLVTDCVPCPPVQGWGWPRVSFFSWWIMVPDPGSSSSVTRVTESPL